MAIERGPDGFYHPSSEAEIVELVERAHRHRLQLRVRGAAHTAPKRAIYTTNWASDKTPPDELNVLLDRYRKVTFDDAKRQVTVQAGCNLGADPNDPAGTSTYANGLLLQLDQRGWALPHTGGIIHQTVSGFLSTGSNGGSVKRGVYGSIVSARIVDGTGKVHELHRDRDERFFGAIVSMGLWGVLSTVTLQCEDRFDIRGKETITRVEDCPIDLFGAGPDNLAAFLRNSEYARLMWWPQKGAERMVVWQAHRMKPEEYDETRAPKGRFTPKPYSELGKSPHLAESVVSKLYDAMGKWQDDPNELKRLSGILPPLIGLFVPLDGAKGPQRFWDAWWRGLPMDNEISDEKLPIEFSELWIPLDKLDDAMRKLKKHYDEGGLRATGTLSGEIYGAQANNFWMHPSYQQDMARFDFLWYARNEGRPERIFYPQYWELFKELGFRVHWGKHVPSVDTPWTGGWPGVRSWTEYLRAQYPRWDDFLQVRAEMDPKDVFLTRYWRRRLGLLGD